MTEAAQHSIVFGGETFAFLIERTARRGELDACPK